MVAIVALFCLVYPSNGMTPDALGYMYHLPIYTLLVVAAALSFVFTPPEVENLKEVTDDAKDVRTEIEHQFKFARSFCLAIGLVCLFYLFDKGEPENVIFNVNYVILLVHMAVFAFYMALRSLKEESPARYAILQMGLLTGISLLGMTLCYTKLSYTYVDEAYLLTFSWKFVSYLVFAFMWFAYIVFWVGRLRRIVRFSVKISD